MNEGKIFSVGLDLMFGVMHFFSGKLVFFCARSSALFLFFVVYKYMIS